MITRSQVSTWAIALGVLTNVATAQVLWKEPPNLTVSDWVSGRGGAEAAPRLPFKFVKENLGGTNPKIDVTDAAGRTWVVKFGPEVHADTFAARFLYAVGYASAPTFFVQSGIIENVHQLKRAKPFLMKNGSFNKARFKLHQHHTRQWSWVANPFTGSLELGGLKIMIMLLSNWDSKDARDGEGSNNGVFEESPSSESSDAWFAVTDWGASFGRSGSFFQRDRWDWQGYSAQSPRFARLRHDGSIQWGFRGKHGADIIADVGVEDVRWLLRYLSRITDEELTAGLVASGASRPAAQQFTRAIRSRVQQLEQIAKSTAVQPMASK